MKNTHDMTRRALKTGFCLCAAIWITGCNSAQQSSVDDKSGIVRLGDNVAVLVNDSAIYTSDVNDAAIIKGHISRGEILKPDHPEYRTIVDELIDQRLLTQKARTQNLHKRTEAKRRIATAQERILGNIVVEEHLAKTVTDDAARSLYEAQMRLRQSSQEARASHILVESKVEAEAAKKRLDDGEDFAQVAFDLSLDQGSRAEGGDLGYFQADAMVAPFSKAIFALQKDEVSMPFETQFGWHVAKLIDLRAAPKPSFEDMRDQMINFLTYDEIKLLLEGLHAEADITYVQGDSAGQNTQVTASPLSSDDAVSGGVDEDETPDQ